VENVEIVRRAAEAFNARDLETWASFFDPECEFVDHMGAAAEEEGASLASLRRLVAGWFEAFPDFRANIVELIDAGDRVVSVTEWRGTGAGSGLDYHQDAAEVLTIRDGKIVRLELGFADGTAALEAAGSG
jgi:ketosteroid isomerase-like protein